MKYHIDTVPVIDAFEEDGDCAICALEHRMDESYVDEALGGAVMEPSIRVLTNAEGFCPLHLTMLFDKGAKLPLSLMTHTHIQDLSGGALSASRELRAELSQRGRQIALTRKVRYILNKLLKKDGVSYLAMAYARYLKKRAESCHICKKKDKNVIRYLRTVCVLHKNEPEFRRLFDCGKGFCLLHYSELLRLSAAELHGKALDSFLTSLLAVQDKKIAGMESAIEDFTLQFDYRNSGKPYSADKKAPARAIGFLAGYNNVKP